MLGSLFTRQPLTVAFNAAAAAMKGFHEGDKETIDLETKNWKNAVDVALKQNQKELDTYKLAWDQHKENFQDLLAEFEAHAAGYKDEQMLTLLKYAGPKEIWEMLQHRIEAQSKIQQSVLGVEKTKAEITKLHAQADQARTGGFSDEDLDAIVERRLAGDVSVEAGLKRGYQGAQTWARYQAKLAEAMRDQGITPQQLLHTTQRAHAEGLGIGAEARTTGTMTARVENAVNELQTTIPLALNSSRNLPRGTFVPFNRLYQTWLAGTSDPAYNDFITRNLAVVNAYARAMNPQGIPRIAEREENKAIGILSTATSQQAYEVQLRALWAEAQASKKATQETAKSVTEGVSSGGDFPGDTKKKSTGGASGMTDEELMAIVRGGAPATPAAPSAPVTPAQQAPMYVPSVGP